jgi:hypothetical protein
VFESILTKYKTNIMTDKPEDVRYNAALATLENVYGVQVPRTTERVVVSRLFTICARDQIDKFTPDTDKVLRIVGAKPPVLEEGRLSCFGVLYQKNHRVCQACGLRAACHTEALNYGLGDITLSPKVLGSKNTRFATFTENSTMNSHDQNTPASEPATDGEVSNQPAETTASAASESKGQKDPFTTTERDEVVLQHLKDHFKPIRFGVAVYYTHKDGKNACIFSIGNEGEKFALRFCKPSDELKKSLLRKVRSFYAPDDMSADDVVKLVNAHGTATFGKEDAPAETPVEPAAAAPAPAEPAAPAA